MMGPSSISLPSFSIESKMEKTILNSAGRLEIRLPDSCGPVHTALELEQVVGKANVWIARQGLCHFIIDLFVNGTPVSQVDTLHHLETVIMGCDVGKVWQFKAVSAITNG